MNSPAFRIRALPFAPFRRLFEASDDELRAQHAERAAADSATAFPCRVSMQDATVGELLVLLEYPYHPVETPYRASGPIFIRENASSVDFAAGEVPELLRRRFLSVRGYDQSGYMRDADVTEGRDLPEMIDLLLTNERITYLHLHNARTGCYLASADRGV